MIKSEKRKARKTTRAAGQPLTGELALDRGNSAVEFGPERLSNGKWNHRRECALHRHARLVYDYDRPMSDDDR